MSRESRSVQPVFVIAGDIQKTEDWFVNLDKLLMEAKYDYGFRYLRGFDMGNMTTLIWLGNDDYRTCCYVVRRLKCPTAMLGLEFEIRYCGGQFR